MATDLIADFGDGEYRFWLPLPQVTSFEREHGSLLDFHAKLGESMGIDADGKFHFLAAAGPKTDAILALVRLALIGGGSGQVNGAEVEVGPVAAKHLVADYCYPSRPLEEAAVMAFRVVDAAVRGISLKKKAGPSDEEADPVSASEKAS